MRRVPNCRERQRRYASLSRQAVAWSVEDSRGVASRKAQYRLALAGVGVSRRFPMHRNDLSYGVVVLVRLPVGAVWPGPGQRASLLGAHEMHGATWTGV